ncbi:phosphatidylinositol-specific phospholipase C [Enhygromyxa salina]|nr:phosphatidylinositol-specific phospholipase C [Enhygromyxa salina]
MSHKTYLKILNATSHDIINISVDGVDSHDWDGRSRPDRNSVGVSIPAGAWVEERQELSGGARSAWYSLHMTFANGQQITLRNDQHDAHEEHNRSYGLTGPDADHFAASQSSGKSLNTFSIEDRISPSKWMARVSGSQLLSQLSIPGTHDSGSYWSNIGNTHGQCQNLSIGRQLGAGIRLLDIRARHIEDRFTIHHGAIYQRINFDDVLDQCQGFLRENPAECILMLVNSEYDAEKVTRSFEDTFRDYVSRRSSASWYLGAHIPRLDDVRGKIVLLRRFPASAELGINLRKWGDNSTFSHTNSDGVTYHVTDRYRVDSAGDNKLAQVENLMAAATADSRADSLYIAFLSGSNPPDTPRSFAFNVNPRLHAHLLANHSSERAGVIALDFCDNPSTLVKQIILRNS